VVIAENLRNLRAIQGPPEDGRQWMVHIMPLAIEKGDGSPVRAYAIG
jgi:kynurenine formamidase